MTLTFEIKATERIERHLNRNPRVVSFCDVPRTNGFAYEVSYNPAIPCPAYIRAEARAVGLGDWLAPRAAAPRKAERG